MIGTVAKLCQIKDCVCQSLGCRQSLVLLQWVIISLEASIDHHENVNGGVAVSFLATTETKNSVELREGA